jgi:hypothetical protein
MKPLPFAVAWTLGLLLGAGCGQLTPVPVPMDSAQVSGGATTGPLVVRRVELQFTDGRPRATVPQGETVTARARIRFDGTGLLRATWLVDGRALQTVSMPVSYGDSLTLDSSPGILLPTFEPGPHEVVLRIDQPAGALTVPAIVYTVTGGGTGAP